MFADNTKQLISIIIALQALASVSAQALTVLDTDIVALNVSTSADDYIRESRRQYNATLQSFLDQIADINKSLEDQVNIVDKQKDLLLQFIKETNEKLTPLELLSVQTKYCVQKYKSELPYGDIVKANIDSCITTARNSYVGLVATLNTYCNNLYTYYNADLKNVLALCSKSFQNPSTNYTLCVSMAITKANQYTNDYRKIFATAKQSSTCGLGARMDSTVSCANSYFNSAFMSLGAVDRLINDCIYNTGSQSCPVACPNVKTLKFTDAYFTNATIDNPLRGMSKGQDCVEIKFN